MNFSNNLRKIRKSLKLSQAELAQMVNISQRTISHYEKADSEPELLTICRLADAFNITIDQLLGYDANADEERYIELKNLTLEYYHKKKEAEYKLKNDFPI